VTPLAILGRGALAAATAFGLVLALSAIGFGLLPRGVRGGRARLALPLSLSFGATLYGWLGWLVGSVLGTRFLLPLLGVLLAAALPRIGEWAATARREFRGARALAGAHPWLAAAAALPLVLLLPQLLIPVVDSDGLRYHAALAKLFLLSGRVFLYPWDAHAALPQGGEILFATVLRVGPEESVKWLHAFFFAGTLALLAALVHRGKRERGLALAAPLLFAASPLVLTPAGTAFLDHVALFHLATAALLVTRRAPAAAVGIALAGAVSTKLTSAVALAGLAAAALLLEGRRTRWDPRTLAKAAAGLFLPAAVALAPLALRNVAATGDPFFPAGLGLLGRPIPGLAPDWRARTTQSESGTAGLLGLKWTTEQTNGRADEVAGWHPLLGLAALALVWRQPRLRPLLGLLLPLAVVPLLGRPSARHLLPALWGLAPFEAEALLLVAGRILPVAAAAAAAPSLLLAVSVLFGTFGPSDYLLGRMGRSDFLARAVPGYRAAELVNGEPAGGKVMALDFPGPFYFSRPWVAEGIVNEPPLKLWLQAGGGAEALLAKLRAEEVRYLVVTPGYGGGTRASLLPLASSRAEGEVLLALRSALRLAGRVDGCDVFEVPRKPGAPL
jgi:hypothetical protein